MKYLVQNNQDSDEVTGRKRQINPVDYAILHRGYLI